MTRRLSCVCLLASLITTTTALVVGINPVSAVGTAPDAYVLTGGSAQLIDTSTRTPVGSLSVGTGAIDIAFSADGTRAGIVSASGLTVIDTATNAAVNTVPTAAVASSVALAPDASEAFVMLGNGTVNRIDLNTGTVTATYPVGGAGDLAVSPDGSRLFVASGGVHVVDLATGDITSWDYWVGAAAIRIAVSPDGTRGYVLFDEWFSSSLVIIDLSTGAIVGSPVWGQIAGHMALSPDGTRLYLGVQSFWADTGYGAAFFPGRSVSILDTASATWVGQIDLGGGIGWSTQNTASGIAVTPDGGSVYIGVPRIGVVMVADTSTNTVVTSIPTYAPGAIGIEPDPSATPVRRIVNAVDDSAALTTLGGPAGNVLDNDTIDAVPATSLGSVGQIDGDGISIDASGTITVAPGLSLGTHVATYRLCERAVPTNCDTATVSATISSTLVIDAVDDSGSALPGQVAVANVLSNDTLDGSAATAATVRLSQVNTSDPGVVLNPSSGAVVVRAGTAATNATLRYRICEAASPVNCDEADVNVTVRSNAIDAVDDTAPASRAGTTAALNVLANDSLAGVRATTSSVVVQEVAYSGAAVRLDPATGNVSVGTGAPIGSYRIDYRICERLVPSNCDSAIVTVNVGPYVIDAVDDSGRGSSKLANRPIANVLANDRFANGIATLSTVTLTQVSSTSPRLVLDPSTGAVNVTGRVSSGLHSLVYRICDRTLPTNCDTATARVDLSGGR